jgi:DNA (cytosine-5)-methyltransferase 1
MDSGYNIRMGIDNNEKILKTYKRNFNHIALNHDLNDWKGAVKLINDNVPDCNVIVGSPPCTEFSRAGNQIETKIASLTVSFAQIVTSILPVFFIMENVPDVLQSNSFATAANILTQHGYSFISVVKDARYANVPQNRRRFFMIGCASTIENNNKLYKIFQETQRREKVIGVKQYCANIGLECPDFLYFFPRNKFQAQVVDSNLPYPTMRSTNGVCMNKNPLTPGYIKRPNDMADLSDAATISIPIASAISSFPPDFQWPDNRKDVGIQLGNCVPPGLSMWIGKIVAEHMHGADITPIDEGTWVMKPKNKVLKKVSHCKMFFAKIKENSGDLNHPSIKIDNLTNLREKLSDGAFRNSDICEDARRISYKIGSSKEIDDAAFFTIGFDLKVGWTFVIKERICQKSRIDDLFVLVPGQTVPFRGKSLLLKNKLL